MISTEPNLLWRADYPGWTKVQNNSFFFSKYSPTAVLRVDAEIWEY